MPVDGRTGGEDAVVVLRVALRLHQSLATARRAAHEIGIARGLAVERLRQRLAHHRHLVDAEVRIVLDGMPVQPAVGAQGEAPAAPFVAGVGGGCREAQNVTVRSSRWDSRPHIHPRRSPGTSHSNPSWAGRRTPSPDTPSGDASRSP